MLTERAEPLPQGWSVSRIGEFAVERTQRAGHGAGLPVLSVTKHHGIVRSDQFFSKRVHGKDTSNYKVVYPGQFAYATIHLNEGSIGLLRDPAPGIVSPMYTVFDIHNSIDPDYLFAALKSKRSLSVYQKITQGTVSRRGGISFRTLSGLLLHHPPLPEQRKIAAILSSVYDAIEKTRTVIDQVQVVKRGLMQELLTRGLPGRHTRFKRLPNWRLGRATSSLEQIPEIWDLVPIVSVARLESGHTPSRRRTEYWHGDVQWISLHDTASLEQPEIYETKQNIRTYLKIEIEAELSYQLIVMVKLTDKANGNVIRIALS